MAVRTVLRMGDPQLHLISEPIENFDPAELGPLVDDLWDTMAERGGIGLAAPQIGIFQRVVVFGLEESERCPDDADIPRTVLINPLILPRSEVHEDGWEGCLSIPGMRGLVPRYTHIRYTGVDQNGNPIDREADGYHARVVQHECDHLEGVLYPMRIEHMENFGFDEEITQTGRITENDCID